MLRKWQKLVSNMNPSCVMRMVDNKEPLTTKESDAKEKLETKMACESINTEGSEEGGKMTFIVT